MALKLDDSRWWSGDFERFASTVSSSPPESLNSLALEDGLRCTTCDVCVGDDRFSLVIHYRSKWHKFNLRRKLHEKPVISEEEFEGILSEKDEVSESSSSGTEGEQAESLFSGGAFEYFTHGGNAYSVYKCILFNGEQVSKLLFSRPLNCVIFLLAGGHFAAGVFKDDKLFAHKAFHRYTVRAKQGGLQSTSDARCGKAKSAGATLRRYNEKALNEDIEGVLSSWNTLVNETPLIFIRSPTYKRSLFVSDSLQRTPILRTDERLRTIPFGTHRPSIEELMRIWTRLRVVREHGEIDEFRKEVEMNRSLAKKKLVLQRTRRSRRIEEISKSFSSEDEKTVFNAFAKPSWDKKEVLENTVLPVETVNEGHSAETVNSNQLSEEQKQSIYLAVRMDSLEKLHELMSSYIDKRERVLDYFKFAHFPPDRSTFLHVAAKRDAKNVLLELLQLGCDPCLKDAAGSVPFEVAASRGIKRLFSEYRAQNPDAWDWKLARIPEVKVISEEKLQKETEKRKQQKERRRLKEKLKKEEELIEKEQKAERDAFLALSEREKRALAAERRLAASLSSTSEVILDAGNRCFQCGRILPAKPFVYSENRFCQVPCVIQHRQANQNNVLK